MPDIIGRAHVRALLRDPAIHLSRRQPWVLQSAGPRWQLRNHTSEPAAARLHGLIAERTPHLAPPSSTYPSLLPSLAVV